MDEKEHGEGVKYSEKGNGRHVNQLTSLSKVNNIPIFVSTGIGVLLSIDNVKFWPVLAKFGYFVANMHFVVYFLQV